MIASYRPPVYIIPSNLGRPIPPNLVYPVPLNLSRTVTYYLVRLYLRGYLYPNSTVPYLE